MLACHRIFLTPPVNYYNTPILSISTRKRFLSLAPQHWQMLPMAHVRHA